MAASRCIRRLRRARDGRARRWCPSAFRRVVETLTWPPSRSRTTSEQVASKAMPATASAASMPGSVDARRARRCRRPTRCRRNHARHDRLRLVHGDRMLGAPEQGTAGIEDAGARAAGADIDGADIAVAHGGVPLLASPPQSNDRSHVATIKSEHAEASHLRAGRRLGERRRSAGEIPRQHRPRAVLPQRLQAPGRTPRRRRPSGRRRRRYPPWRARRRDRPSPPWRSPAGGPSWDRWARSTAPLSVVPKQ